MPYPTLLSRAKVPLLLLAAATAAAQSTMPSDASLARESGKLAPRSAAAISKAEQQAKTLRQPVPEIGAPAALPSLDPAALAKRFDAARAQEEPGLFILVSFSMPLESIERLADQAAKAGGTIVLRGVIDDSLKKTAEVAGEFVKRHPGAQFQIDPTLFRRFNVSQVPAFVLSAQPGDANTCGKACDPANSFAMVAGDVTLDYALEYIAKQREPRFAELAENRLQRIRRKP